MRSTIAAAIVLTLFLNVHSEAAESVSPVEETALTVYNQDFALVKEVRSATLRKGTNEVNLRGVASGIDPTSVHIESVTRPGSLNVFEQNYEFDLVNYGKILDKYVGREVEVHSIPDRDTGKVTVKMAKLLSSGYVYQPGRYGMAPAYVNSGLPLYEIDGKIHSGVRGTIVLPELPEGLIMKPTLFWLLDSKKGGRHKIELSYITSGIKWNADYVALVGPDDKSFDLTGWVTVDNRSGVTYKDASLKLVAGDVNVVDENRPLVAYKMARAMEAESSAPSFKEEGLFEYHMYSLDRRTTVKDNEIKQIEFTSASSVPLEKKLLYDGFMASNQYRGQNPRYYRDRPDYSMNSRKDVWVMMEFDNTQKSGLGIPLPKGKIRLYKADADGSHQFIGEDLIDHTPTGETVKFYAGNAFDVKGERKQVDFKIIERGHVVEETFEVTISNHKDEDVMVTVREHLYRWLEWDVRSHTHDYKKTEAQTIEYEVPVRKGKKSTVRYTVRYTW